MKQIDIFRLAVRLLGLVFIYRGLSAVPLVLAGVFGSFGSFMIAILTIGWPLLVAYWLLRGAPLIMHIAYRNEAASSE